MPIYEYGCKKCGAQFEILIRNDGDLPKRCPECGEPKPTKQFSAFAVAASHGKDDTPFCETCPTARSCPSGACPMAP